MQSCDFVQSYSSSSREAVPSSAGQEASASSASSALQQPFSSSFSSLLSHSTGASSPSVSGDVRHTGRATVSITIDDPGLPVSIWTSISNWQYSLPMTGTGRDATGRLEFAREFDGIPEEPFHYKVHTADGKWVIDETKPFSQDKDGNVNNIAYVKHAFDERLPIPVWEALENAQTASSTTSQDIEEDFDIPLLRHETFQQSPRLSPRLGTIQEEATEPPSTQERARSYQRALIEAMPGSIADGFTRASVLLPARNASPPSDQGNTFDELSRFPIMRHESTFQRDVRAAEDQEHQPDELDQAPLMRHETISNGTTLVEDNGSWTGEDGVHHQYAVHHTADSEASSELMFRMDMSWTGGAQLTSSVYSNDWVSDESDRSDWDSQAINIRLYGQPGPSAPVSGDAVDSELYRSPTFNHEVAGQDADQRSDSSELDDAPTLSHEQTDGTSTETTSERSRAQRALDGEIQVLSPHLTNSFSVERLRDAFNGRIFGATRVPLEAENAFGPGGVPLMTHGSSPPGLRLHSRATGIPPASLPTSINQHEQRRDGAVIRRRLNAPQRPATFDEEDERLDMGDETRRFGMVFEDITLPPVPPPQANVPLAPKASSVSFLEPSINHAGCGSTRCRTPYPSGKGSDTGDSTRGNIAQKIYRHFFSCFASRYASIIFVGIVTAGAALWWKMDLRRRYVSSWG
ncbi:hypothetical protein BU23DRAFT_575649 [Bimuria novae-zelandiae CBS 107.79]|uniref:Uncharacterized protein n=1 Tax=Bimuria novae-zelandiae CBS 107.79 TaxID=1447943 RepID=A0A6A5UJG3_9PLEO|nr:hypothetical protein BU23DRAFT_575649 [Bimuria novae-zelandiae CBS 107.79]